MATSNVNPAANEVAENPGEYKGKVTRKVTNPFDGKEVFSVGDYVLPLATSIEDAQNLTQGNIDDLIFWFNYGRKVAARQQVNAALGFDLGSDELNDLFKSFTNAMDNMVTVKTSPEKRAKIKDFILSEDKFEALRSHLDGWKPEGVTVDFNSVDLKKPSGKRGRPGKDEESE